MPGACPRGGGNRLHWKPSALWWGGAGGHTVQQGAWGEDDGTWFLGSPMLSLGTAGIRSEHSANVYGIKYLPIVGRFVLWEMETPGTHMPQSSFQCTDRVCEDQAVIYHRKAGSHGTEHSTATSSCSSPAGRQRLYQSIQCAMPLGAAGAKRDGHNECLWI